jgi:hypothetical protein
VASAGKQKCRRKERCYATPEIQKRSSLPRSRSVLLCAKLSVWLNETRRNELISQLPSANWLTKCSKRWRLARPRIGTLLLRLTRMMFADIRAARRGCVPVVGRRGARSGSGSTCPGCNDHQPQNGVARGRGCPTYTR